MDSRDDGIITVFKNCQLIRNHKIYEDDLWVRNGKIIDPAPVFYKERRNADVVVDCHGKLIVPGYIEVQINGAFGVDFSYNTDDVCAGLAKVAKGLLSHGVTSFCPTVVTSPPPTYHKIVPMITRRNGSKDGAGIVGLHLEGPFISKKKKGAHPEKFVIDDVACNGLGLFEECYGPKFYENTALITVAPEIPGMLDTITQLVKEKNINISIGHSMGTLKDGEKAVRAGANFITHLFNAMLPFHHRDPGLVGLLTSWKLPKDCVVFYGMIADGIHTHPASMRIAHRTNPHGLVLVSDAIVAAGLSSGTYNFGQNVIDVQGKKAYVAGTETLAGSIALLDDCVKTFYDATECSKVEAIEGATLHPAQFLGITNQKGTLDYETDADFLLLDDDLNVTATYVGGECVYQSD